MYGGGLVLSLVSVSVCGWLKLDVEGHQVIIYKILWKFYCILEGGNEEVILSHCTPSMGMRYPNCELLSQGWFSSCVAMFRLRGSFPSLRVAPQIDEAHLVLWRKILGRLSPLHKKSYSFFWMASVISLLINGLLAYSVMATHGFPFPLSPATRYTGKWWIFHYIFFTVWILLGYKWEHWSQRLRERCIVTTLLDQIIDHECWWFDLSDKDQFLDLYCTLS